MREPVMLSASILSADLACLRDDLRVLETAEVDWLHIDVMDGQFVPMLTVGAPLLQTLKSNSRLPVDVHLMVAQPERLLPAFVNADVITIHAEATAHLHHLLQQVKELGAQAGVALNPGTSISALDEVLSGLDLVMLLAVNPGIPKQRFIPETLDKIRRLRERLEDRGLRHVRIGVDGGINLSNAADVVKAGANILVSGSAVFSKNGSVSENIMAFRKEFARAQA